MIRQSLFLQQGFRHYDSKLLHYPLFKKELNGLYRLISNIWVPEVSYDGQS